MSKLGFKPVDFWLLKEGLVEPQYDTPRKVKNSDPLCYTPVSSTDVLGCWGYHVAAGVQIEVDGQAQIMIIDPWTQGKLTTLNEWALSFFAQKSGRTAYVFPVKDNYKFYGSNGTGQISYSKKDWEENLDDDNNQLYCGLCGITPNEKCEKKKFGKEISDKRAEIQAYLKTHGIEL
ncbi:MAG: hypothetical protein EOO07_16030 [Chitinophagaceae bacterium]|nr:MAG: hypothetical protein EOO07_16030 [Chitinophagaceae bacterium]